MNLNWQKIDKQIVGEAWVGSNIETHVHELCTNIGPRWATSAADKLAAEYVTNQMNGYGPVSYTHLTLPPTPYV